MQKNVLEYLKQTVQKHGQKTAVKDGDKQITFLDLDRYAHRCASLIGHNFQKTRKPVAVYLPKSGDALVAFMSILYSGNFYVPLDIHSPKGRIKGILEDLGDYFLISSIKSKPMLLSMGVPSSRLLDIEAVFEEGTWEESDSLAADFTDALIDTDPAYIMYTSGSTGKPKGVVISHRSIIDYIDWAVACFDISHEEIIGSQSPFFFDNSTLDIYLCLSAGATLIIIPEKYFAFPLTLMEFLVKENINFIFWVPSVMIQVANRTALDMLDAGSLKKVLFAGEVMPNRHLNYWREKLPGALFANLYGPTEITVDCSYYIVSRDFDDNEPLPIGFACSNTDILILKEGDTPACVNDIGELCVRGSSLALGYWNNPGESQRVFVQNPLNPHYFDRMYRTGDLVFRNELNEIIFVGRKDSQIKHLGYRIELGEIESAVLSLEGIDNACVLYDQSKDELLMLYEGSCELEEKEIRLQLVILIPKYMIPTRMVRLESLPYNQNGKIDRRKLAQEWIDKESKEDPGR